ncbi:glycosyltransferase family 9 protein [uncultured Mailhella sp.]|uniref:glycosyltransferase family 9 protein n=1 Tax=uncultured Mailhella sp. TaxID=1981031 RepID=UPI0026271DC5|nr:glycosyltransferase family 9 protein [uncultured Mailhella sp.]
MARYSSLISNRHMVAVRFSSMGDVALTTGVLLDWHKKHETMFTVVTRAAFAPLFDHHPAVQEVIGLLPEELSGQVQAQVFHALVLKYKDSPLLDLHRNLRSAMLARSWRDAIICYKKMSVARRLFLWSRGRLYGEALRALNVPQRYAIGLYNEKEVPPAEELRPRIFLSSEERERAASALASLHASGPLVALHPFATHTAKTWSMEIWLRFAALLDAAGIPFFWVGLGEGLPAAENGRSFIGKTDLRQLCGLLEQAAVLVTGDSGPMHLATAVGTPVLALFGPTCREWGFFPSGPKDTVIQLDMPCRPCSLHGAGTCSRGSVCMTGILPEQVLETLKTML